MIKGVSPSAFVPGSQGSGSYKHRGGSQVSDAADFRAPAEAKTIGKALFKKYKIRQKSYSIFSRGKCVQTE